jgi:hypothetical protein
MTGADGRLNKMYRGLTAKERAILVLSAWKQDKGEDPLVRWTMPPHQFDEFNRYIGLMNGVNRLVSYALGLGMLVDQLGLRFALLRTLDLWAIQAWTMADYIWFHTREPVIESEHRQRLEAARAELVPVKDLAEVLVRRHEGWCDDDLVPAEDGGEPLVSEAAWDRMVKEKKAALASLVAEGVLGGKRQGRRLMVNAGSFYNWLEESVPVSPDWGLEFDVRPDAEAEEVERLRRARRRAHDALIRGPSVDEFLRDEAGGKVGRVSSFGDEMAKLLVSRIREEARARWQELLAVERVIEEAAAEFNGVDPALPDLREALQAARRRLEELVPEIQVRVGPVDLEEGSEEILAGLRAAMKNLTAE